VLPSFLADAAAAAIAATGATAATAATATAAASAAAATTAASAAAAAYVRATHSFNTPLSQSHSTYLAYSAAATSGGATIPERPHRSQSC
jgi:hypothetical protein